MTAYAWIVCGLVAVDAVIVALWFLYLRSQTVLDRQSRVTTGVALSGFIVHAFLFLEGLVLYVQLAVLAIVYMSLFLWPSARHPVGGARSGS
jgi:hypothetical protein